MTETLGRVVADADVLAADLLVGGAAREALDLVRAHAWMTLVTSDPLLDDAATLIRTLSDDQLATDWRGKSESLAEAVAHPPEDHPALAAAYHGDAPHLLTFDEQLLTARAGASVRANSETSLVHPDAFVKLFDPAVAYQALTGDDYPGPDRDPRA